MLTLAQKNRLARLVHTPLFRIASVLAYAAYPVIPRAWRRLDRPIFIVGCSRSGTTLLAERFAQHQALANWTEAGELFALDYYDPDIDHLKEAAAATRFEQRRLAVLVGLCTRLRGKRRFVNKNPQNSLRIRYLRRIFPDAMFIHLIRDGRAVVLSNDLRTARDAHRRRTPFGNFPKPPRWRDYAGLDPIAQFAHQWVDVVSYVQGCFTDAERDDCYTEIRYEDFCRDPRGCLSRLDAFCGLAESGRDRGRIEPAFEERNGAALAAARPEDLDRIAPIIGPLMTRLGYGEPEVEEMRLTAI